jgi:hypothetical protein
MTCREMRLLPVEPGQSVKIKPEMVKPWQNFKDLNCAFGLMNELKDFSWHDECKIRKKATVYPESESEEYESEEKKEMSAKTKIIIEMLVFFILLIVGVICLCVIRDKISDSRERALSTETIEIEEADESPTVAIEAVRNNSVFRITEEDEEEEEDADNVPTGGND